MVAYVIKCGMKLLIHSQTSTVAALKFRSESVILSHTLLRMWLFIHVWIRVRPYELTIEIPLLALMGDLSGFY